MTLAFEARRWHGPARTLRLLARLGSVTSALFLLLFFVAEGLVPFAQGLIPPLSPSAWVGLALFPVGTLAGLAIAWRREGWGGLLTVVSVAGFYLWMVLEHARVPSGPYFALAGSPGLLFLLAELALGVERRPRLA